MAGEYVEGLARSPGFAKPKVHAVVSEALLQLLSGGVAVGFAAYLMLTARAERRERDANPDVYLTPDNLDRRIRKVRDVQIRSDLIAGAITLFAAVMTLMAYRPTNAEVTQAALLKYLRLKGVVGDDFVDVLKNVRPYRIKTVDV